MFESTQADVAFSVARALRARAVVWNQWSSTTLAASVGTAPTSTTKSRLHYEKPEVAKNREEGKVPLSEIFASLRAAIFLAGAGAGAAAAASSWVLRCRARRRRACGAFASRADFLAAGFFGACGG